MKQYLEATRSPWVSYLFSLPLLFLYQVVALVANLGHRRQVLNGADALLQSFLSLAGLHGWLGSWLVVAAVVGAVLYRVDAVHRKGGFPARFVLPFIIETTFYGLFLGVVVSFLTALVLPHAGYLAVGGASALDFGQKLAAGLGAGLYEELVFRLLLTGGLIRLLYLFGMKEGAAAFFAVRTSSFVFSLVHYIGVYGDPLELTSFLFRLIVGVF